MRTLTALVLLSATTLTAQNSGQISGKIADKATKQPLPDAVVAILGTKMGTTTDGEGHFTLTGVPEDIYKIQVSFIGYDSFLKTDVRVVRGKTTYVEEIELTQSVIETEETVVAAGYFREDAQAPISAFTYTRDEIRRAPGATGDVFRAMETLPGVSTSGGEFSAFSVRGGSPEENIILIDNIPFDKVSHFSGGSTEEQDKQGGRFSFFSRFIDHSFALFYFTRFTNVVVVTNFSIFLVFFIVCSGAIGHNMRSGHRQNNKNCCNSD